MKRILQTSVLPKNALFITCSSHEERCQGIVQRLGDWQPNRAILFHYDDHNPIRESRHKTMLAILKASNVPTEEFTFTEWSAVKSLRDNMERLGHILETHGNNPIVFDITVFTKRHLLMILRWLDDIGYWDKLSIVYTEPDEYDVSEFIPLSFGLKSIDQIPGFSASPDLSRPVHLVLFLGYEGDRALAVYEHLQPMQTTLAVPHPPYKEEWLGRTEDLNRDLLALISSESLVRVDAIDPEDSAKALEKLFANTKKRSEYAKVVCPIGTKPQALGVYYYVREAEDPPAVIYASPLRHNHGFSSHGIGKSWILRLQ